MVCRPLFIVLIAALSTNATGLGMADSNSTDLVNNAALWYWRCFNELQLERESSKRYIELLQHNAEPVDEGEVERLRAMWSNVVATAEVAASKDRCAFGIDRAAGLDAMLPHLEPMRRLSKIVAGEANRAMECGDHEAAMRKLNILCRMAAHTQQDEIHISTLVAASISSMALSTVEQWLDDDRLIQDHKQQAIHSLSHLRTIGPACLPQLLIREREATSQWMLQRWSGPKDYDEAVRFFRKFDADPVGFLVPTDLVKDLQRFDAQMVRIIDAAENSDISRLETLCGDARHLKHGIIASVMIPPYQKTHEQLRHVEEQRSSLLQRLQ